MFTLPLQKHLALAQKNPTCFDSEKNDDLIDFALVLMSLEMGLDLGIAYTLRG